MTTEQTIVEKCAEENGAYNPEFFKDWNGYRAYICDAVPDPGKHPPATGYPLYILVKNGRARMASGPEAVDLTLGD